ncbi:hypothetical protein HZ326_30859 [Fusarium oxysporum f. sp. albedinis]|nr:hypothetical protein HZ326_30859 [Fusarium oxysporum f. sp. albedinis]
MPCFPTFSANITLLNCYQQFIWAILDACLVDKIGHSPLLLFSFSACTVVWPGMTIASSEFAKSYVGTDGDGKAVYSNATVSKAALSMVFIFGAIFSFGIMPLQTLHPVEVLSFEMRAKGMAFSNLAVNAAGLLNQFSWPVARKEIGWKTYNRNLHVMLCYVMLCYVMLCYVMLCYVMLCYVMCIFRPGGHRPRKSPTGAQDVLG